MQKIKKKVTKKIRKYKLTKTQINILFIFSKNQNEKGEIIGVYYKVIFEQLNITIKTYYNCLNALAEKGFITLEKEHYQDCNITILDNDFSNGDYSEGYLNIGQDIFCNKGFFGEKANVKLMIIELMCITGSIKSVFPNGTSGTYCIGISKFYKKFASLLDVKERSIKYYLKKIKKYFKIDIIDNKYYITLKSEKLKVKAPKDVELMESHIGKVVFRRNKVTVNKNEKAYKDTIRLIRQYSNTLKDNVMCCFAWAVAESIKLKNIHIKNPRKWKRELYPKFIHKLMIEKMNLFAY